MLMALTQRGLGSLQRIMKMSHCSCRGVYSSEVFRLAMSSLCRSGRGSGFSGFSLRILVYIPPVLTNCTCIAMNWQVSLRRCSINPLYNLCRCKSEAWQASSARVKCTGTGHTSVYSLPHVTSLQSHSSCCQPTNEALVFLSCLTLRDAL